jgi:hypothetical protein
MRVESWNSQGSGANRDSAHTTLCGRDKCVSGRTQQGVRSSVLTGPEWAPVRSFVASNRQWPELKVKTRSSERSALISGLGQ